jgi:hypothetical protein|tara:strand:+ start:7064 stop:7447 length:384 start_codon:yes stop_codon:yes gene_type:complete
MPFIDLQGLDEDYEDHPVAEGEYELRIEDVKDGRNKKNTADQSVVRIKVMNAEEGAGSVFHYLTYPCDTDEPDQVRGKMRNITRFLRMFGIEFEASGFNSEDMIGATGTGLLTQEAYEGRVSNKLRV